MPPSNDKITLVRGDGTLIEATREQAGRLALLGYKEQTAEDNISRLTSQSKEDFYTSAGQKLSTAAEGLAAGATFGATDYLFGDDETKLRAQYNPGTRMGTEILGAVAPLLMSGGTSAEASAAKAVESAGVLSKAAKLAPTTLLSDAARALGGSEGLTSAVTRGVIEGGVYGGAGAANHAYLDGDPVTAEAVLHGIGWGALVGGALSGLGHGITSAGEGQASKLAKQAETEATASAPKVAHGALKSTAGAEYEALHSEVSSLSKAMGEASKAADVTVKGTIDELLAKGQHADLAAFGNNEATFFKAVREAQPLYDKVSEAVKIGKFEKATEAAQNYVSHVTDIAKKMGVDMPNPGKALDDLIAVKSVAREFSKLPRTIEGFASMPPAKLERTLAALDRAKTLPFEGAASVSDAAANLSKAMGIDTSTAGDLRSTWRAAKEMYKQEGRVSPAAEVTDKEPSFLRKAAGYVLGAKAYVATSATGIGKVGSYAAYRAVKGAVTNGGTSLAAMRANGISRVRQAAANYLPGAGRAVSSGGPKTSYLSVSLFGEKDDSTKDKKELAANRLQEIAGFAPQANNTIYRAVEPLSVSQPFLAPALHQAGVKAFQALHEMMPRDPGVLNKFKSIWKPSDVHAAMMEKQLEVFHDPQGAAESMLNSGKFDPIKVEALKSLAPNTWQDMRVALLERITQPGVLDKTSYRDQIGLSLMIDIPIHSSMAPEYIATSQQMFLDRNQPLKANPRMGQGGGMPNPSDKNATSAQKSTER